MIILIINNMESSNNSNPSSGEKPTVVPGGKIVLTTIKGKVPSHDVPRDSGGVEINSISVN